MIGRTVSHYKILEKLGGGGMGVVYKARDLKLDRFVALKFLPPEFTRDTEARNRFITEAKAVSSLQHANICTIHDIEEVDYGQTFRFGQMFTVMDFYEGETLNKKIEHGPLPEDEALDFALQVGRGLAESHRHDITHRDIKPANIMITNTGSAQILDFGLAKLAAHATRTKGGTTMGTLSYMSPEQLQGNHVDSQSDIWSLGVVLYQMLTGKLPFSSEHEAGMAYAILNVDPVEVNVLNASVSEAAVKIVRKAMTKNRDHRYRSMEDMLSDLVALRGRLPGMGLPEMIKLRFGVRRLRRFVTAIAAAAVLAVILFLIGPTVYETLFPPPPRSIAVLSCLNETGDRSYDRLQFVVANALTTKLEQFGDIRVTTPDRLVDLAKQSGEGGIQFVDNVAVIGHELGIELCKLEDVDAAVLPSVTKVQNFFITQAKVIDVSTGRRITGATAQGLGVESILSSQIDQICLSVALRLGLGPGEDEPTPMGIADVTTSSIEAYSNYVIAGEMAAQFQLDEARQYCLKAIERDSMFALAYGSLGSLQGRLGNPDSAKKVLRKAKRLAYRATEKERLFIEGEALLWEEGHSMAAFDEYVGIQRRLLRKYPKEKSAMWRLGWGLRELGRYDEAIEVHQEALELDPDYPAALGDLGWIYALEKRDFETALGLFGRNVINHPRPAGAVGSMGAVLFMMGRWNDALAKMKLSYELDDTYTTGLNIGYVYALQEDYFTGHRWVEEQAQRGASPSLQALGYLWKGYLEFWCGRLESAHANALICKDLAESVGNLDLCARADWLHGFVQSRTRVLRILARIVAPGEDV
jgi:tetratricopeptide (TPR) repeat protein